MIERWVVSRYSLVSWSAGRIEISSAASGTPLSTYDLELVRLVHAFVTPRTIDEAIAGFTDSEENYLRTRVRDLIHAGILIRDSGQEEAAANHWEKCALAYHKRARRPDIPRSPDRERPEPFNQATGLFHPLERGYAGPSRDFVHVLEARQSWREWPKGPIPFEKLSAFLWLSARARTTANAAGPDTHSSRPYPSGGAMYSLELYLVVSSDAVASIPAGIYRYLPHRHGLESLSTEGADYLPFLYAAAQSAGSEKPPIVILVTSRYSHPGKVYGDLAYSLILKEVGCLFQTFYLVGELLNLGPCALGGGAPEERLARICKTTEFAEPIVGEFVLGSRDPER